MSLSDTLYRILNRRILQHLAFWLFFIVFEAMHISGNPDDGSIFFGTVYAISKLTAAMTISYLNIFVFIPQFLEKNKPYIYLITLISTYFLIVFGIYQIPLNFLGADFVEFMKNDKRPPLLAIMYASTFMFVVLTSLFHFVKRWVKLKDIAIELKEEQRQRLEAELKTLKAQINPHFLFNTLNNIYSLSLDKSDKTPNMILKLSDLMSYIIYDARDETIQLQNEIEFVRNHVELEKIRISNQVNVTFWADESLYDFKIAPLLFTPFIENAFKYVTKTGGTDSLIEIKFILSEKKLYFHVTNSAEPELATFEHDKHGIGIENVKKRLQLIYPRRHELTITHTKNEFIVDLKIDLT